MVFRLEDGFQPVVEWLDKVTETKSEIEVAHHLKSFSKPVKMFRSDIQLVQDYFAGDYEAYGYEPEDPMTYPVDRIAMLRTLLAAILAPVIVYRQRRRWLK